MPCGILALLVCIWFRRAYRRGQRFYGEWLGIIPGHFSLAVFFFVLLLRQAYHTFGPP